ncbi:MAG: hypothetical protein Tsb009_01100 [Planctomycetaceae bacterium]
MDLIRRIFLWSLILAVTGSLVGCSMFHELQPHRLKRWNYGINGTPTSDYD